MLWPARPAGAGAACGNILCRHALGVYVESCSGPICMKNRRLIPVVMLAIAFVASCSGEPEGKPKAAGRQPGATSTRTAESSSDGTIRIADVDGKLRSPLNAEGASGVVVLFIGHDCPISNGY